MDLRQLRYLVALEEERSFTRAAAREHVAQPSLSQQIKRLEDEVGLALVERTTRTVRITEAGRLLVIRARRIVAELEAARTELESLHGVETGHVSVGAMHTMGVIDISLVLASFHERHPRIGLAVREESSEDLAEMLRTDVLDVAFLSVTERIESHGLGLHQLISEELMVIVPPGHRLAGRPQVRMAELAREQFISYREGSRLRELLLTAAAETGFRPRIVLESNESRRIRRLVSRGMGVALLPRSDVITPGAEVATIKLVEPALARDITLAWRESRRLPPAAREFLRISRETFLPGPVLPAVAAGAPADEAGAAA
jgi:LysR family transcriptional regulator, transcription activator of glutamate synthase operon